MPQTPWTPEEAAERKAKSRAWHEKIEGLIVLIRKPGDSAYYGPVENSFSLSVREGWTQFWVNASKAKGFAWDHDGRDEAKRSIEYWKKDNPDFIFEVYDARDAETMPVVIDWDHYYESVAPSQKTLSGVVDKYGARNLRFKVKETPDVSSDLPAQ